MKVIFSNKRRSQLIKVFWITFAWLVLSTIQFYQSYYQLLMYECDLMGLDVGHMLVGSILTTLIAGILGGTTIVFLWERWLRTKPYGRALVYILGSFSLVYFLVSWFAGLFMHTSEFDLPFYHPTVIRKVWTLVTDPGMVFNYLYWLLIVLITTIALLVNDKYGPGVFKDFIFGKYFHPRKEERIFMFLDMRSSTTIAEQLGEDRYFSLIREMFSDFTEPIIYSKGEIYQYVGDEIVISWKMENGLEQANCLNCFFEVQKKIARKAPEYQRKYGVVPEFKAGLHYGYVMAGEVGVVKRDIAFSGDVLNTTSRIQEKCNELGVNVLFSKYLLEKLSLPSGMFKPKEMGDMLLRGKQERVVLYTV